MHQLIAINWQLIGDPDQTIKFAIIFYQPIILIANQLIANQLIAINCKSINCFTALHFTHPRIWGNVEAVEPEKLEQMLPHIVCVYIWSI